MNKLLTGVVSALLVAGIVGIYIPNALATIPGPPTSPSEICSGNIAAGQQGNSAAEQEKEQSQTSGTDGQSIAPEFNALTGNNLNLDAQQNGDCLSPLPGLENENPLAATTALQNSTTN